MAQVGWVYLDNHGGQHRVGLYHGDQSGHLVIHCNLRVVQIDFSIKEDRTYSFFIEDELCEVDLRKEPNGRFSYDFRVNKTVDTPRNRIRRADERQIQRQLYYFGAGVLLFLAVVFFGLRWYGKRQREKEIAATSMVTDFSQATLQRLSTEGKDAVAELFLVREGLQRKVFYGFTIGDSTMVSGKFAVADTGVVLLPNGFPLQDHDAFRAVYLPSQPHTHRIDYFLPTPTTIESYARRAAEAELAAHPDSTSPPRCACLVESTLALKGWVALADILLQQQTERQNPRHNQNSYLRLVRDPEFAKRVLERCWDK